MAETQRWQTVFWDFLFAATPSLWITAQSVRDFVYTIFGAKMYRDVNATPYNMQTATKSGYDEDFIEATGAAAQLNLPSTHIRQGQTVTIRNSTGGNITVSPSAGDQINMGGAGVGVVIPNTEVRTFVAQGIAGPAWNWVIIETF